MGSIRAMVDPSGQQVVVTEQVAWQSWAGEFLPAGPKRWPRRSAPPPWMPVQSRWGFALSSTRPRWGQAIAAGKVGQRLIDVLLYDLEARLRGRGGR